MTETSSRSTEPRPADWLMYHITHPPLEGYESGLDPNAIFFWGGRYHFHYFAGGDAGQAFVHISSPDLVHWTWHPTVLTDKALGPGITSGSGFMTKDGRPAIITAAFPGDVTGGFDLNGRSAKIAIALDDQLDSWSAPIVIEPQGIPDADLEFVSAWDPHCWLEGDTYYAIYASLLNVSAQPPWRLLGVTTKKATLFRSTDLTSWEYVGPLLSTDLPEAEHDTDISCPDFFPLGGEHVLLCISHNLGCRYYIGEWKDERFTPTRHGRMNWQPGKMARAEGEASPDTGPAVLFAPETFLTPDGRRVMWAWCQLGGLQPGVQCLPRELSLPDDGILRIAPLRELEILRSDEVTIDGIEVSPSGVAVVPGVVGDVLECAVTIRYGSARRFGVVVLCDADGAGGLPIEIDTLAETLRVDDTVAPFTVVQEPVTLRVFVDKAMVEVFADDRQAVIGTHSYAPGNVHVGLFANDRVSVDVSAWQLDSIYADEIG